MTDEIQKNFEEFQCYLAQQPPLRALSIIYNHQKNLPQDKLNFIPIVELIKKGNKSRRWILQWIYGDNHLLQALTYLKLPSYSKRSLVFYIADQCASRYPWISSKMIHFMAFHPDEYNEKSKTWGPLYKRQEIPRGGTSPRLLEIPNPPLRRIQRIILAAILDPAMNTLPSYIYGCRPGLKNAKVSALNILGLGIDHVFTPATAHQKFNIFYNAAAHLHQHFVINFDLKNFFGSVRLNKHVIPALMHLKGQMLQKVNIPWKMDAAVLISRLVTWQGHLPQGAPTSPAVANLVFHRYDQKIIEGLGKNYLYSRYVDDITISISEKAANKEGLPNESQFRSHVEQIVEKTIAGSGFKLNAKKTRAGNLDNGFTITGLQVKDDHIDLSRDFKRKLRSLIHHIQNNGFINTANSIFGDIIQRTQLKSFNGRRFHIVEGRRLSMEKLAVIMLKSLCPDLRVNLPSIIEYIEAGNENEGGVKTLNLGTTLSDKKRWTTAERLLTYLWNSEISARISEGQLSVEDGKGKRICLLQGNLNLSFFILRKNQALSCITLWYHLNGLNAFLKIKDQNPCFEPIRIWQSKISDAIKLVRIVIDEPSKTIIEPPPPPPRPSDPVPLTEEQVAYEMTKKVYEQINDYRSHIAGQPISPEHLRSVGLFLDVATNNDKLRQWISAGTYLCMDDLTHIPCKINNKESNIFDLLRIVNDRFNTKRSHGYKIENEWLSTLKFPEAISNIFDVDNEYSVRFQLSLLKLLQTEFQKSLDDLTVKGMEQWKKRLIRNEWQEPITLRLRKAVDEFLEVHIEYSSESSNKQLFKETSRDKLAKNITKLREPISDQTSPIVWGKLFETGKILYQATTECLIGEKRSDEDDKEFNMRKRNDFKKMIGNDTYRLYYTIMFLMRCREAHGDEIEKRHDWRNIQKNIADLLGRNRPSYSNENDDGFSNPNDLQLTPLEGTEIKLKLIRGICNGLKAV